MLRMGWASSAARWALLLGAVGVLLTTTGDSDDPGWFIAAMVAFGGLFGLFWHHRDRVDAREDAALREAARYPASSDRAVEWVGRLRAGQRVRIRGAFVTLTAEGIEWTGLRKGSLQWRDVDDVSPSTITVRGIRSARSVRVRGNGKVSVINCSKRNFVDVLATCSEMARAASWPQFW